MAKYSPAEICIPDVDDALVTVSCLDIQYGILVVEVLFQVVTVKYVDADDSDLIPMGLKSALMKFVSRLVFFSSPRRARFYKSDSGSNGLVDSMDLHYGSFGVYARGISHGGIQDTGRS